MCGGAAFSGDNDNCGISSLIAQQRLQTLIVSLFALDSGRVLYNQDMNAQFCLGPRDGGLLVVALGCWSEHRGIESRLRLLHLDAQARVLRDVSAR